VGVLILSRKLVAKKRWIANSLKRLGAWNEYNNFKHRYLKRGNNMSPTIELKLSNQEQNIINYLDGKDQVAWQELAQFGKDPTTVKRVTLLKVVSELRKKYAAVGLPAPFNCKFFDLGVETIQVNANAKASTVQAKVVAPAVQMRKTLGGKLVRADNNTPDAHLDFELDKARPNQVRTKNGWITLNESCYELFHIFHQNVNVPLSKEDLKNKIWPQWGSRTPGSWWGNISGRMTGLRTCIPELKTRLNRLVIDGNSFFMLR
jgi:hypothetical protein